MVVYLATHVHALLCAGLLVLQVNSSSTLLHKQSAQLQDGRCATVTGVSVRNDGAHELGAVELCWLVGRQRKVLLLLLAVVEDLSLEELLNLSPQK